MTSWPSTLPQQFIGLDDGDDDSRLVTPMDAGEAIVRRRFTSFTRSVSVPMTLKGAQRATFDEFYRTTLKQGSLSFEWEDPATDETKVFRFKQPVRWRLRRGGPVSERVWVGTMQLEILAG